MRPERAASFLLSKILLIVSEGNGEIEAVADTIRQTAIVLDINI